MYILTMLKKMSDEVMVLLLLVMLTPEIKTDASLLTFSAEMSLFRGHDFSSASGDGTRV